MERVLIIGGNMNRTLPHRLKYRDTVFYLDFSSFARLNKEAFLYNKKFRKKYYQMMAENPQVQWILLKNRRQVKGYLKKI